jgi:sortase A
VRQRGTVPAFLLSLSAFLAIGGVILLLAPRTGVSRTAVHTEAPGSTPSPVAEGGGQPATGVAEYPLIEHLGAIPRPELPIRLVIPAIALDARVVEVGIVIEDGKPVWETAAFAVGYHRGTALPGEKGNTVMAGHISSPVSRKGEVFRRLPEVRIGDRVEVYTAERQVTYEITEIRVVAPTAVEVMDPTPDATLTLITCYPDRLYTKRLVVVAKLVPPA